MRRVLVVLLLIVLGVIGFIATRPPSFHIERSATVAAPAEVLFAKVSNLHNWAEWSPWEKLDPNMTRSFEGAESGVGAGYHWAGNDKVGEGRMTVTEAEPSSKVGIRLEFVKPFQAVNTCSFTFVPAEGGTRVTWSMDGKNDFMAKAFSLFMNMDKQVGGDFEKGLASLKTVAEATPAAPDSMTAN